MASKKIKLLLFTDNYNPKGGGAEKVFFKLIDELKKENIKVNSFGFGPNDIEKKNYKIIKETKYLFFRHFWRLFFNIPKYIQIRRYIKKINPDVIHIHNINKYTSSLLLALRGYKVIQTVHDYSLICPTLWNVHNNLKPCPTGLRLKCLFKHKRDYNIFIYLSMLLFFYQRNFLLKRIVNCFIAPSPQLKKYLDKNGFKNIKFIPNIIDIKENIKPNFNKINYNQILYIGQLEKNKGVHILVKEMKYIIQKNPNVILKIAGSGSEKDNLIKLIKKSNLGKNIQLLGWVNDISKLIQESASLVVPSIGVEQFGLVTFESMAYFRPVIGSNRGATPWLIGKNCGFIFNPLKKKDLSKNILNLLKNKKVIQKKGLCAREKYLTFPSKNQIIKKMLKLYNGKI